VRGRQEKDVSEENAMNIGPFFGWEVFGPDDIKAISIALDEVCSKLGLTDDKKQEEREVLAKRIMALARHGERDPAALRDSVLRELAVSAGEV
jgi:hypothetical protein